MWRALLTAGRAQQQVGDLQRAEAHLQQVAMSIGTTAPPGHIAHGGLRLQQGSLAAARGELDQARELLRHAAAIWQATGPRLCGRILVLIRLAEVHSRLGEQAAALARAEEALALARQAAGGFVHSYRVGIAALAVCEAQAALPPSPVTMQAAAQAAAAHCDRALAQLMEAVGEDAPATRRARAKRDRLAVLQPRWRPEWQPQQQPQPAG